MFVGWITNSFSGSRLAGPTRCVKRLTQPVSPASPPTPRGKALLVQRGVCCRRLGAPRTRVRLAPRTTGQSTNDLAPPQLPADLCPGWKDGLPGRDPVSVDPGKVSEAQGQAPGLGSSRLLVF